MPFPSTPDARLQPALFNPVDDLALANAEHSSQAFYGEEIAPNVPQAQVISAKHVANRLGSSVKFLCDLFYRSFDQFLTNEIELRVCPSSIFRLVLDAVLNDESPTSVFRASGVPLNANDELLKFAASENLSLGSHSLSFRAPVGETLGGIGKGCHRGLDRRNHQQQGGRELSRVEDSCIGCRIGRGIAYKGAGLRHDGSPASAGQRPNVHTATERPDRTSSRGRFCGRQA
jgi:hypothetical protein